LVTAAFAEAADGTYDEKNAVQWAGGFRFSSKVCNRDLYLFDLGDGDLVRVAGCLRTWSVQYQCTSRVNQDFDRLI